MHGGAAQVFRVSLLANGSLHERWAGEKKSGTLSHEDGIGHDGKVGSPGNAHAHDGGDLGNTQRAHHGVVTKDAAEIVGVREDILLQRKEDARRIDKVERGDAVFKRDVLRPQHLLGSHGKERAGFDRCIVGNDHAKPACDAADASNDAGARCPTKFGVHAAGGP